MFLSSYKQLYQTEQCFCPINPQWNSDWCAKLNQDEANGLVQVPLIGEIWSALKSMKPYKAPGINGLHARFFQSFWLVVRDSMKREVKGVFLSQKIPEYLNQTLIALIPKQTGLETVSHFRPISLCSTVYKIISKIIAQRVRPLLPSLISPMQADFLEGRRSSDNVIIAQELIYYLKSRKGKDGYMVIKIDLEKAYDRLEWSFVKMVLEHFEFPQEMINLIISCISTTTIALLFNGRKLEAFQPSRGMRQGDPISPYLFLLCMEFLGAQITSMCERKRWDRMKASRNGLSFSHVFFADDLMLFAKANHKNCEAVIEVYDNFCNLASQKVNLGKSKILFSPNVSRRWKRYICRKMGMTATNNLGRYLGFPLLI